MSLNQALHSARGRRLSLLFQCFNVAAICALGVWHGYAFRMERQPPAPLEWKLAIEVAR